MRFTVKPPDEPEGGIGRVKGSSSPSSQNHRHTYWPMGHTLEQVETLLKRERERGVVPSKKK